MVDMFLNADTAAVGLAIIVASLALIVSAVALLRAHQLNKRANERNHTFEKRMSMTSTSVIGMGNRVLELENRLAHLRQDQKALSDTQQDYAYSKAKQLLEQGLSAESIAASCGLSVSEVELLKLIHAQHSVAAGIHS